MAEETVWRGSSSQWINFGRFILAAVIAVVIIAGSIACSRAGDPGIARFSPLILLLLILPIFMVLAHYLQTKSRVYELTTERLKTTEGVFSKVTDTLELYRVKDMETRQPFFYRLGGVENIQVNTSDSSSPVVLLEAIPSHVGLADKMRNQVEAIRSQKGVREVDVE